ncbi:MAG: GatB/YqeY domain-containing protein [Proteobacteria bacterium]|nr:GatB/YqeY domain-containing protein [Pseudomonadota bacterium]
MLRTRLSEALKDALKAQDRRRISTIRLILAAVKDRDITLRGTGKAECIADEEILNLLQTMVRQRNESIEAFEHGKRKDLADSERAEIAVIRGFLPPQLSDDDITAATREVINELNAAGLKDMGRVMAALKAKYAGEMDFGKASSVVKTLLA